MAEGIDALVLDVKCGDGAFLRGRDEARGPGPDHARHRQGHGQAGGRAHHRHGPAPRAHGRQRARGGRVRRDPQGPRAHGPRVALRRARGLDGAPRRAPPPPSTPRGRGCARRSPAGPASSASAASSSCRAATPASATTPRSCPRPGRRSWCAPSATGAWRASPRGRSATPGCSSARAARRSTVRSTPRSASSFHKKVGDPVAVGEPIVTVHVGKASRREEALARLREAIVVAPEAPPRGPLVLDILS